jgi:two-component system nitrogen regulation response regulator GlnG/two-component system response regulator HydG
MTETLPEDESPAPSSASRQPQLALVIVWSSADDRVGEVLLPSPARRYLFGRGGALPDDDARRLELARQRPGETLTQPPLETGELSRRQLRIATVRDRLSLENVGRLRLSVNGEPTQRAEVGAGDLISIGQQLVMLVVSRPHVLPGRAPYEAPFGAADRHGLVGESPAAWRLRQEIAFVAPRSGHVLILGASGTGKELVAQAIHARSPRGEKPIVSRNAATLPESLVDAELFGNTRGYPNPTMAERPGLVGRANGSTLFLDEIAELPSSVQAHLLRVLDAGEYQRLGEADVRRSDLRLVAATNRPLSSIKEDLSARFLLRLETPDLTVRREDVPLIARHLVARVGIEDREVLERFGPTPRFARDWMAGLVQHPFTTHVREVHGLVWDAIARSEGPLIGDGIVQGERPSFAPSEEPADPEGARIQRALDEHNGSIEATWRALGYSSRFVLRRLIARHGVIVRRRGLLRRDHVAHPRVDRPLRLPRRRGRSDRRLDGEAHRLVRLGADRVDGHPRDRARGHRRDRPVGPAHHHLRRGRPPRTGRCRGVGEHERQTAAHIAVGRDLAGVAHQHARLTLPVHHDRAGHRLAREIERLALRPAVGPIVERRHLEPHARGVGRLPRHRRQARLPAGHEAIAPRIRPAPRDIARDEPLARRALHPFERGARAHVATGHRDALDVVDGKAEHGLVRRTERVLAGEHGDLALTALAHPRGCGGVARAGIVLLERLDRPARVEDQRVVADRVDPIGDERIRETMPPRALA